MEGPLVSDTTELLGGAPSASEDAPAGNSAPPAAAGGATSPTSKSRSRGGTGLSSLLLPELQRMAQSMGIPGAGRMRKGQLVEAIQARQGGAGIANQGSDQRVASAGADSTRLRKQDAMEPDTRTQPGIGDGAAAGIGASARGQGVGIGADRAEGGEGAGQQLSFDQAAAADRPNGRTQQAPAQQAPAQQAASPAGPGSGDERRAAGHQGGRPAGRDRGGRHAARRPPAPERAPRRPALARPRPGRTRQQRPRPGRPRITAAITAAGTRAAGDRRRPGRAAARTGRPGPGADGGRPWRLGRGVRRRQARWPQPGPVQEQEPQARAPGRPGAGDQRG